MPSLEDDLASCDQAAIMEYVAKLKKAEEFAGRIVRFEPHGETMLVIVLRDGDSEERTYPLDRWGFIPLTTVSGSSTSSWSNRTASSKSPDVNIDQDLSMAPRQSRHK